MQQTFPTQNGVLLDLRVTAGEVRVEAAETAETQVAVEPLDEAARELLDEVRVERHESAGGRVTVVVEVPERKSRFGFSGFGIARGFLGGPQFAVAVRCPLDADVTFKSASAGFEGTGRLGAVTLKTASGDLRVAEASGRVEANSASGDLEVGDAAGPVSAASASGDVTVRRVAGDLRAQLVSGDLSVGEAGGAVEANTVSGDQRLELAGGGNVNARSISGDVSIGVRRGTVVWLDVRSLSGDTVSELEDTGDAPAEGAAVELRVNTVSGDVRLHPAGSPLGAAQ